MPYSPSGSNQNRRRRRRNRPIVKTIMILKHDVAFVSLQVWVLVYKYKLQNEEEFH
jgi:hypothetical protein